MRNLGFAALALLAVSIGFGIWIACTGIPYRTARLTVHKLTGVAFAVLSIIFFVQATRMSGMTTVDLVLAVSFAVALIGLLATGGLMSARQQPTLLLRLIHAASTGIISISACWKFLSVLIG